MTVELAQEWADRNHRVLPVAPPPNKRPLIKAWQENCSTSQVEIHAWWYRYPEARVGIATGAPGHDVLDFDVAEGKPGLAQLEKLIDLGVIVPGTFKVVTTPSGGRHLYFKGTDQRNKQNEKSIPGVDFRSVGGMVLAAGNDGYRMIAGKHLEDEELATVDWEAVRQALAVPETAPPPPPTNSRPLPGTDAPPRPPARTEDTERAKLDKGHRTPSRVVGPKRAFEDRPGEDSAMEWYTQNHLISDLLFAAGWKYLGEIADRQAWQRPGKDDRSESGNVKEMPDGRPVFYNFSSSTDFPVNTAMSAAQVYAHLEHGGSESAAAKHIRTALMPPPPTHTAVDLGAAQAALGAQPRASEPATPTDTHTQPPETEEDTPGSELVPILVAGEPVMVTEFWDQHQVLKNIRWFARERRVSPWAMLGAVLAQASCRIGPHVVLPPIVGGVASLNLLVGLVGPSGKGKGAATATATEFLGVDGLFMSEEVGTSQGIDASFTEAPPKGGPVQFNDVAFFYVPEIDTIKAHAEMSGSALLPTLRKVWSGEPLGAKYAGKERRRPVRGHAYRASVVAGIQPKRSGVLLADADGGTPQRWLWLPVADPGALRRKDKLKPPRYHGSPPRLDYDVWIPGGEQRGEKDEPLPVEVKRRYEIPVCRQAENEMIDARELNLISDEASMDSHTLLTRLKVAALINFLCHQELEVGNWAWELTKPVMWISNATRQVCIRAMEEAEEEEHSKRGRGRAIQQIAEQIAVPSLRDKRGQRIEEIGLKVLNMMQENAGVEFSPRELKKAMGDAKTGRDYGDDVMTALIATPGVVQGPELSAGGRKIRKLSWTARNILAPSPGN